jgi:hypothetical protein
MSMPNATALQTSAPVALIIAAAVGMRHDKRRHAHRTASMLETYGFERCEGSAIDPDIEAAAAAMAPVPLPPEERMFLSAGEIRGRTVYLAQFAAAARPFAFVAVQTARPWPPAIIRRKRFLDQLHNVFDLGHRAFDAQREMRSEHPNAAADLAPLADWFVTDDKVRKSFRMHEIPGKAEQWSFRANWVALADHGHARPKHLLQLADFLTAFAEAADELTDPPLAESTPT